MLTGEELKQAINQLPCHFTWGQTKKYSDEIFFERLERNEDSCLSHLEETPDQTIYNFLAYLYVKAKDMGSANTYFNLAIEHYPDDAVTLANFAHLSYQRGMISKANEYLEKCRAIEERLAKGQVAWAWAYFEVRMFHYYEAIAAYDEAIGYLPEEPILLLLKAIPLNRKKRFDEALTCLKQAAEHMPDTPLVFLHLGRAYADSDPKLSQSYFNRALQLSRHKENVYKFMGNALRQRNKLNPALTQYNLSIQHKPTTMAYHHRGLIHLKKKNIKQALLDFNQALALQPKNYGAIVDLMALHVQMKNYDEALTISTRLHEGYKNGNSRVLINWAKCLEEVGEPDSAAGRYLQIFKLRYVPEKVKAQAEEWLENYYRKQLQDNQLPQFATKLLELYLLRKKHDKIEALVNTYGDACSMNAEFTYLAASYYAESQQLQSFVIYLRQAFNAAQTPALKYRCHKLYQQQQRMQELPAELIRDYLEAYSQFERVQHVNDAPIWSKNLAVLFNSKKKEKSLTIDASAHAELKQAVQQQHHNVPPGTPKSIEKKIRNANFNKVMLSFIVSDRPHDTSQSHGRRCVSIVLMGNPDNDQQTRYHVSDYYTFDDNRKGGYKRSAELLKDVMISKPMSLHHEIQALYLNTSSPQFHRRFHCSERALFGMLNKEETINRLLDQIDSHLNQQPNIKFYAMLLDLHSDRYLCHDCEQSMFYWYRPTGEFMQRLIAAIQQRGHKVQTKSGALESIVRVSALKPAQSQQEKTAIEHGLNPVDIKAQRGIYEVTVLQRNDTAIDADNQSSNHVFTSSK